jgi:endonuclease III
MIPELETLIKQLTPQQRKSPRIKAILAQIRELENRSEPDPGTMLTKTPGANTNGYRYSASTAKTR